MSITKKTNWQTKKFEDCLDKVVYTNKIQRKDFLKSGLFPIISQESENINGYWDDEKDLFKCKKPVVIFGDHTQVLKYVDFDFVLGADGVKILQPKEILDSRFYYFFLQSIDLKSLGYARHYRLLKEIDVSFPPLPEQHRIVKILDKVFADVAKAKENAEKNLQNVKELFEAYLQETFSRNHGLGGLKDDTEMEKKSGKKSVQSVQSKKSVIQTKREDWEEKKISEVCEVIGGGTPKTGVKKYWDGNLCWVTPKDLGKIDGDIISDTSRKITQEGLKNSSARLSPVGSVILSSRAPIGYVVINNVDMATNQGCKSFVCGHQIYNKFLYYFLISNTKYLNSLGSGATFKEVSGGVLKNIKITFPSFIDQKSIVAKLDTLSAKTKKLETIYQQKLTDLEELKKSVLKKAFNGEL